MNRSQADIAATISIYIDYCTRYELSIGDDEYSCDMINHFLYWPPEGGFLALLDEESTRSALTMVLDLAVRLSSHDHYNCGSTNHRKVFDGWCDDATISDLDWTDRDGTEAAAGEAPGDDPNLWLTEDPYVPRSEDPSWDAPGRWGDED